MNKAFKWSIALLSVMAVGCAEDDIVKKPAGDPAYTGDDVVFTFAGQTPESRTTYAEPWGEPTETENGAQQIYWGNYITDQVEQIKIYCRETDGNMAVHNVNPNTSTGSSTAISIGKADENTSIRWGAKYTDRNYEFYSFYPASAASDAFIGTTGHEIQASIETGQVPRMYKYKVGDGEMQEKTLAEIAAASGQDAAKKATIFAMPDMESAIMMAHSTVSGTPNESTGTGWGYPVPLDFKVLADVLDITVNGPVTPNTLGGNADEHGQGGIELKYIKIRSITIESKSKAALSGKFTLNMDTKEVTPIPSESNYRILVSTSVDGQYPTLHVRSKEDAEDGKVVDQLRARVFLMPGQVKNLNDPTITVGTDCGDYTVNLESFGMVSGAIHPIKLNYFKKRGVSFDFKQWIGQLDPNIYLSELSIPGSWHSGSPAAQGDAASDMKTQYDAGIRAFEVHTRNTSDTYTDYNFTTRLTADNADYSGRKIQTAKCENSYSGGSYEYVNSSYTERTVNASDVTVQISMDETVTQEPKYALRLYRTNLNTAGGSNSISDAVKSLANSMNPTGFMFLEFGMNRAVQVTIPVKVTYSTKTATLTNVSLVGSQKFYTGWGDINWTTATVNGKTVKVDELYTLVADNAWTTTGTPTTTTSQKTVSAGEAWAVAVQSCLNRLSDVAFTGKDILYKGGITPNTTIADVKGKVIVKINTNDPAYIYGINEEGAWTGTVPALFSRWVGNSGKEPRTINLKWGGPIAPLELDESASSLHWCYTELDNIGTGNSAIQDRISAMTEFANVSYTNYTEGLHRTFYECAIGGYLNGNETAVGYKAAAKALNPALLNIFTDPTRKPSPMGFVFINYVIPPTDETDAEATYRSAELIRTIINNNAAFMLQRKGGTSTQTNAADNTNSSFTGNTGNPLK